MSSFKQLALGLGFLVGLAGVASAQADSARPTDSAKGDIMPAERREVRRDTREIREDRREMRQDRRELRRDMKEGDKAEVRRDKRGPRDEPQLHSSREPSNLRSGERPARLQLRRDRASGKPQRHPQQLGGCQQREHAPTLWMGVESVTCHGRMENGKWKMGQAHSPLPIFDSRRSTASWLP